MLMTEMVILDDSVMARVRSPICWTCQHKRPTFKHYCDTFPQGIPDEIWTGKNDHTQPYEGDQGIQYEPRQPKP